MKKITMDLVCVLDASELEERGQTLSATTLSYDETEEKKRVVMKEMGEELKAKRGEMRRLSNIIRSGQETRPVSCAVEFHTPTNGVKRITRLDTGEFVRDEPMSGGECQSNLAFMPDGEPEFPPVDAEAVPDAKKSSKSGPKRVQ